MALGGGNWTTQNKVLPGTYINFVSSASVSSAVSDRGVVAMPLTMEWGVDGDVFEVTSEMLQNESLKILWVPIQPCKIERHQIFVFACKICIFL